jgi:excisionase family DNA binding protein
MICNVRVGLRLLIRDITVEKRDESREVVLHIRWQGGACEDLRIDIPPNRLERERYSEEVVERVRDMASTLPDREIALQLNGVGCRSARGGKPITGPVVREIRQMRGIPAAQERRTRELTVREAAQRLGVSPRQVQEWIEQGLLKPRRIAGSPRCWVTLDVQKVFELQEWMRNFHETCHRKVPHPRNEV